MPAMIQNCCSEHYIHLTAARSRCINPRREQHSIEILHSHHSTNCVLYRQWPFSGGSISHPVGEAPRVYRLPQEGRRKSEGAAGKSWGWRVTWHNDAMGLKKRVDVGFPQSNVHSFLQFWQSVRRYRVWTVWLASDFVWIDKHLLP